MKRFRNCFLLNFNSKSGKHDDAKLQRNFELDQVTKNELKHNQRDNMTS